MDLQTFVAETLKQIVSGVADAQSGVAALNTNARINPALVSEDAKRKSANPTPVEFDVALTVSERSESARSETSEQYQGLISVVSAKDTASAQSSHSGEHQREAVSRVKFTVQLAQPSDIETYSTNIPTMSSMGRSRYDELKDY